MDKETIAKFKKKLEEEKEQLERTSNQSAGKIQKTQMIGKRPPKKVTTDNLLIPMRKPTRLRTTKKTQRLLNSLR